MPAPPESKMLNHINGLIEQAEQIQAAVKTRTSPTTRTIMGQPIVIREYPEQDCHKWRCDFAALVEAVLDKDTTLWKRFEHIYSYGDITYLIDEGRTFLIALHDNIKRGLIQPVQTQAGQMMDAATAIEAIERIGLRFNEVVKQMRRRHDDRQPFEIQDEYDVQDLLHSLLLVTFDDVRVEEWTPSTAGATSRMDLILKTYRIVIETKMMRKGLTDRKLTEELLIDIGLYPAHPDCGYLLIFIFDPDERIGNPAALRDIEKRGSVPVKVFVSPRR